jgi:tRNA-Thr(GGU) m(6)t(6)A37 methyltransferase TsaA
MADIHLKPIAYVKNSRTGLSDDYWGGIVSEIELVENIPAEALEGIEDFSHLEIFFHFHMAEPKKQIYSGHPRENPEWPVAGIFAQRKKDRPNGLGATIVKLKSRKGNKIFVENLDAIDGTPVLDIKPVLKELLPDEKIVQPAWTSELMNKYWLKK